MSMKDLVISMMIEHLEEKATNPYAIGMAAAMKSSGDEPPLEKSTIRKAHKIAKGIEKNEEVDLDEAKTDIYHKHMLKALGKSRLPKDHQYTSSIANNGDFVVHDGGGRVAGRIAKSEHNLK
jgi:hypothetical protein